MGKKPEVRVKISKSTEIYDVYIQSAQIDGQHKCACIIFVGPTNQYFTVIVLDYIWPPLILFGIPVNRLKYFFRLLIGLGLKLL